MKKIFSIAIALAVVSLTVSAAFAYTQGQCGKPQGQGGKGRIFEELNLTPEQKKQLEDNRAAQRQDAEKLFTAMRQKQEELRQALDNPAATEKSVAALVNEIKALQAKQLDNRIKGIFAAKKILTPEQFAKFQEMAKERKGKIRERLRHRFQERRGSAGESESAQPPL
jgi:Spy/CpxP family protein refolding chaperone